MQEVDSSYEQQQQLSSEQEQSDLKQRQAFFLPSLEQSDIQPQQLEAFQYLMSVKQQANGIRQQNKARKRKFLKQAKQKKRQEDQNLIPQTQKSKLNQNQDIQKNQNNKRNVQNEAWFSLWQDQVVRDWKCVVQNVKFIHSNSDYANRSQAQFTKKQSSQILQTKPQINSVARIPLGIIQKLMTSVSLQYYSAQFKARSKFNYYLWMYSFLACHRALASYSIFQQLATVNACLIQDIKEIIKAKQESSQKCGNAEILVLMCILEKEFGQFQMAKFQGIKDCIDFIY